MKSTNNSYFQVKELKAKSIIFEENLKEKDDKISKLNQVLEDFKRENKDLTEKVEALENEKKSSITETNDSQQIIAELTEKCEKLGQKYAQESAEHAKLIEEFETTKSKFSEQTQAFEELQEKNKASEIDLTEKCENINTLKIEAERLNGEISNLTDQLKIDQNLEKDLENNLEFLKSENLSLKAENESQKEEIQELKQNQMQAQKNGTSNGMQCCQLTLNIQNLNPQNWKNGCFCFRS